MKHTLVRPSIDEYMTVIEAAKLLGVTRQAIQNRIARGRLHGYKTASGNSMYLLLRDEVDHLKATRTRRQWATVPEGVTE